MILIVIPTLDRPAKLRPLAENIRDATESESTTVFVVEAEDKASYAEVMSLEGDGLALLAVNNRKPCYAGAINTGYATAVNYGIPFTHVFQGADDVFFYPGWDTPALALLAARPGLQAVGTNDLHESGCLAGEQASHHLICRRYIDGAGGVIDQPPGIVLCELYLHGGSLAEFDRTVKLRGVWAPCLDSMVEHRHPLYGLGKWDDTYRKKEQSAGYPAAERSVLVSRQHLWTPL